MFCSESEDRSLVALLTMRQDWHPEELERYWTLSTEERDLLGNKTGATRLGYAILLKSFQFDGRFPGRREDVSAGIVNHLSNQTGTLPETFWKEEWNERTQRHQRAQIREHFGFQLFHAEDEVDFLGWLMEHVVSPNPDAEAFKIAAYGYLRNRRIEPPPTERLRRLLRQAVAAREERMIAEVAAQLSQATRQGAYDQPHGWLGSVGEFRVGRKCVWRARLRE
jgi:hypothetical protein